MMTLHLSSIMHGTLLTGRRTIQCSVSHVLSLWGFPDEETKKM